MIYREVPVEVTYKKKTCHCLCGGEMRYTGVQLTSNPPYYMHKCNKCNKSENAREMYPKLITEVVEKP